MADCEIFGAITDVQIIARGTGIREVGRSIASSDAGIGAS